MLLCLIGNDGTAEDTTRYKTNDQPHEICLMVFGKYHRKCGKVACADDGYFALV